MQSLIVASLFGAATLAAPVHDWWNPLEQEPGYGPYDSSSVNVAVGSRYQETKIALYCDGPGYSNNCITQAYSIQQCTPVEPSFRNKIISFSADYQICTLFDGDDCTGYTQPVYASESNLYYFPRANSYRCYPLGGYSPDAPWVAPPVRTHWVTETQTDTVYLGQPTAISPQTTPSPSFPSLSNGHRIHWVTEIITETEYLKQPAATSTPAANPHATSPFQHAVPPLASNQVNASSASPSISSTPSSSTALPQVSSKAPILPSAGQLPSSNTLPLHTAVPDLPVAIGGLLWPGSPDGPLAGLHGVPPAVPPAFVGPGNAEVPHPAPGFSGGPPIGPPPAPLLQKPADAPYPLPFAPSPNPFTPSPDGPRPYNGPSSQSSPPAPPGLLSPFAPSNSAPLPPSSNSQPLGPNGLLSPTPLGLPVLPAGPPGSADPLPNLQPPSFGGPSSPPPLGLSPALGSPSGPPPRPPSAPLLGLGPNAAGSGDAASLPFGLVSPLVQSANPGVASAPASQSSESSTLGSSPTSTLPASSDILPSPTSPLGDGASLPNESSQTKTPILPIHASLPLLSSPTSSGPSGVSEPPSLGGTNSPPKADLPLGLAPLLGSPSSSSQGTPISPTPANSPTPTPPLLSIPTPAPLTASPTITVPPLTTEPPTTTDTDTAPTHYDETTTEEETIYRTEFAPEPTSAVDDIDMEEDDEVSPTITEAPAATPTAADAESSEDEKAETTEEEVEYVTSTARPVHVRLPMRPKPKPKAKKP
ncbi:hypothetical protein ONZ45_g14555 [Pleurotus djamor]|nr:hypothetical protein ONZ45_g14555 [Pleurotus djamor]